MLSLLALCPLKKPLSQSQTQTTPCSSDELQMYQTHYRILCLHRWQLSQKICWKSHGHSKRQMPWIQSTQETTLQHSELFLHSWYEEFTKLKAWPPCPLWFSESCIYLQLYHWSGLPSLCRCSIVCSESTSLATDNIANIVAYAMSPANIEEYAGAAWLDLQKKLVASVDWTSNSKPVDLVTVSVSSVESTFQFKKTSTSEKPFILDTGCSTHILPDYSNFISLCPIFNHSINGVNGSIITAISIGPIVSCGNNVTLNNALLFQLPIFVSYQLPGPGGMLRE